MNEKLKELTKEYFLVLPKEIQEILEYFDWVGVLYDISEEYNLSEEQANDLETEVSLVLLGLTKSEKLQESLEDQVGLTSKDAKDVANEVFYRIISPISDELTELMRKKSLETKPSWDKNVKFILSGGDYLYFMENISKVQPNTENKSVIPTKNIIDLKSGFTI